MAAFCTHARALAGAMGEVEGVDVVPDPPQTPMFHLHLHGDRDAIFERALAVAREQHVWMLNPLHPTALPGVSRAEITIGEPALAISPTEAAQPAGGDRQRLKLRSRGRRGRQHAWAAGSCRRRQSRTYRRSRALRQ